MRKNIIKYIAIVSFLTSTAFASAYTDYQEIQSREFLHQKYVNCIKSVESWIAGIRIATGTRRCEDLGINQCNKIIKQYNEMKDECKVKYGKYE